MRMRFFCKTIVKKIKKQERQLKSWYLATTVKTECVLKSCFHIIPRLDIIHFKF